MKTDNEGYTYGVLSEPEVREMFFSEMKKVRPEITYSDEHGGDTCKYDDWIQDFSVYCEYFFMRHTKLMPIEEYEKYRQDHIRMFGEENADNPREVLNDYLLDLAYDGKFKGTKIDFDDDLPLYFNRQVIFSTEVTLFPEKGYAVVRVVNTVDTRGEDYGKQFKQIDLTKFVKRSYVGQWADDEKIDPDTQNITEQEVHIMWKDVPHKNGEDIIKMFITQPSQIDRKLLKKWLIFKMMSAIFPVKFDPFFEKDGLIHQKSTGHRLLGAKYELPDNLVDVDRTLDMLKICRLHYDHEWI